MHETGKWLRLNVADTSDDAVGIIPELKEARITDYMCIPLPFEATQYNGVTFATTARSGFSDEHIRLLKGVLPAFQTVAEVMALNSRIKKALSSRLFEQ